jgi:hypothetical protein
VSPRLARLRAEIESDLHAFDARVDELAALPALVGAEPATLAQAAVALHHAYGAVEAALTRVARALDDDVSIGPEWHQALLEAMALDVEGVRPAVLRLETLAMLRRLLAFRHFFRHAYAVALDAVQLERLRDTAVNARPRVRDDFARFDSVLRELALAP